MSLRYLRVGASVAALAALGVACGDSEFSGTGLSGAPPSSQGDGDSGFSSSGGGSGSSGGPAVTTTDAPTGTASGGGDSSTGEPPGTSTAPGTTTGVPGTTTSADDTSGGGGGSSSGDGGGLLCGNGVIEGNEQCDGDNINGFTCEALGYLSGTLQCDAVTCTFDTQLCTADDSGGTSG